jgi:hypothetical protein
MPSRKERLLAALVEHPHGVAADILLREAGSDAEGQALVARLRGLAASGQVVITGQTAPNRIASALILPGNRQLHGK